MTTEERLLWHAKEGGVEVARWQLIDRYLRLIHLTRTKAFAKAPPPLWEDMEAEGRLALVKAVDRYQRDRGVAFVTYAVQLIRGAMLEFLRTDDWMPRSVRDALRRGEEVPVYEIVSLDALVRGEEDMDDLRVADQVADEDAEDADRITQRMAREVIGRLVRAMPKRERKLLDLYYWQGLTLAQISVRLDRSESRVHQLHAAAIGLLRDWLRVGEVEHANG